MSSSGALSTVPGPKGDPGGITLGTVLTPTTDLNTIRTSGVYRLGTTYPGLLAYNFPRDTDSGVLMVLERVPNQTLIQEWHSMQLPGRGFYTRHMTNTDVWSAWRFVATSRVDQTAGRAIYQWDDLNNREQLIYGDTGWRNVAADLTNGWANLGTGLYLRRRDQNVMLKYNGIDGTAATAGAWLVVPSGFRIAHGSQDIPARKSGTEMLYATMQTNGTISFPTPYASVHSSAAFTQLMWTTDEAWPATLPGTASGSIPNL